MEYPFSQEQTELDLNYPGEPVIEIVRMHQVIIERPSTYSRNLCSSVAAGQFGIDELGNDASETVMVLALNNVGKINALHRVSSGSLTHTVVHPRDIFRSAIMNNAKNIILYHNHPSGDTTPSEADVVMTQRFVEAGQLLGIQLLDHIIVGQDHYLSMNEHREVQF